MRIKLETAMEEKTAMKEEPPVDNYCVGVVNQTMADRRKNAVTIQTLMSSERRYPRQAVEGEREKCPSIVILSTSGGAPPVRIQDVRQVAEKPPLAAKVTVRTEGETTAGDEKQPPDPPPDRHTTMDVRMRRVKGRVKGGILPKNQLCGPVTCRVEAVFAGIPPEAMQRRGEKTL